MIALKDYAKTTVSVTLDSQNVLLKDAIYYGKNMKNKHNQVQLSCYSNIGDDLFFSDNSTCIYNIKFDEKEEQQKFEYLQECRDIRYFSELFITQNLPVIHKVITFVIPDWVDLSIREFNMEGVDYNDTFSIDAKNNKTIIYTFNNLRPILTENNVEGITSIEPFLAFQVKSYMPRNNVKENIFQTLDDQYQWYKTLVDAVDNSVTDDMMSTLTKITAEATTDKEKVEDVFYWVQDKDMLLLRME